MKERGPEEEVVSQGAWRGSGRGPAREKIRNFSRPPGILQFATGSAMSHPPRETWKPFPRKE